MASEYQLSRPLATRLLGVTLVVLGAVIVVLTVLVGLLDLSPVILAVTAGIVLLTVLAAGVRLSRRPVMVRLSETGYRVRLVRGAGRMAARWTDVEDVVTATASGERVVVIRLRDGGTTTIPVRLLDAGPDAFVQDLQQHLNTGHGYRRIS